MKPYYQDSAVTIYHGDCREILPQLGSIDLLLTDPPYSSGGAYRSDRSQSTAMKYQISHETLRSYGTFSGDNRDQRSFEKWCDTWMTTALRCASEGGVIGCFIDWRNIACVIDALQVAGWVYRGIVPWYKGSDQRPHKGWFRRNIEYIVTGSCGPLEVGFRSDEKCNDGLLCCRVNGIEKEHQTQKPVEIFREFISCRKDFQVIADPFMGSGTALRAAKDLGRKAIGIEIEERYCEIAARRMAQEVLPLTEEAA